MGFVWVHADSFLRCVASPFHSFVTTILTHLQPLVKLMFDLQIILIYVDFRI